MGLLKANSVERASLTITGAVQVPRGLGYPNPRPHLPHSCKKSGTGRDDPYGGGRLVSLIFKLTFSVLPLLYPQALQLRAGGLEQRWSSGLSAWGLPLPSQTLGAGGPGLSCRENERVEICGASSWAEASYPASNFLLSRRVQGAPRLPARPRAGLAAGAHNAGSRPGDWSRRVAMTAAGVARSQAGRPRSLSAPPRPCCGKGPGQPPDVCAGLRRWLRSRAPGSGCGGGGGRGEQRTGTPFCAWGAEARSTEAARARGGFGGPLGAAFPLPAAP